MTLVKRLQEAMGGVEEGGVRFLLELLHVDKFYMCKNELHTELRLSSSSRGIFCTASSPHPTLTETLINRETIEQPH